MAVAIEPGIQPYEAMVLFSKKPNNWRLFQKNGKRSMFSNYVSKFFFQGKGFWIIR